MDFGRVMARIWIRSVGIAPPVKSTRVSAAKDLLLAAIDGGHRTVVGHIVGRIGALAALHVQRAQLLQRVHVRELAAIANARRAAARRAGHGGYERRRHGSWRCRSVSSLRPNQSATRRRRRRRSRSDGRWLLLLELDNESDNASNQQGKDTENCDSLEPGGHATLRCFARFHLSCQSHTTYYLTKRNFYNIFTHWAAF